MSKKTTKSDGWAKVKKEWAKGVDKVAKDVDESLHPRNAIHSSILGAVADVIRRELTEPQKPVKLSDIKIKGLKTTLKNVKVTAEIPTEPIHDKLVKNADKVTAFIEAHGNYYLSVTKTYERPRLEIKDKKAVYTDVERFKPLEKYFELTEVTRTVTGEQAKKQREWNERHTDQANFLVTPDYEGRTYTIKGYKITDYEGLVEAIKRVAQPYTSIGFTDPDDTTEGFNKFTDLDPILLEFKKLAEQVGIEPSGGIWARKQKSLKSGQAQVIGGADYTEPSTDPDIVTTDIRVSDRVVYSFVLATVKNIYEQNEQDARNKREVVNIKDAKNHDVLMQPHAMGLTDMIDGAFEGRELKNLFEDYHKRGYGSNDEIKKAGGWLMHLEPIQTELPIDFGKDDQKTIIKFMTNTKALVIDVTTALGRYFRDHPDHDPNEYISLVDLARYVGRYNDSKLKKGELRKEYRQQILYGLKLAGLIGADYVVGKDAKGNREWRRVYLLERIKDFKTYGNTDTVVGVKIDFTKEYKESVGYNLGVILDGVLLLSTPEHKALGAYILERFAQHQDQTIKGEPQKITADTLIKKAGITDSNKTNKLVTLQKALDAFVANGLIAKWACKNGAKAITGYDRDSQTILVYPTKNLTESYAPKSHTQAEIKANKALQKNRQRRLRDWFKGYTDYAPACEVLGVSVAELQAMLAGKQLINDDILNIINEEL